ncbi:MAG: hypothetical protein AAFV43_11755 [Planctomycetota bacterium]
MSEANIIPAASAVTPRTLDELLDLRLRSEPLLTNQSTITHYRRCVRYFNEHLGRQALLSDLNAEAIMAWARSVAEAGFSPETANAQTKQLKAIWNWAARQRIVETFPPVGLKIRCPPPQPKMWSDHELLAMFDAAGKMPGLTGRQNASEYWTAWLWWGWNTGERTGATLALTAEMIDWENGWANVPGEARKGGMTPMRFILSPKCVKALRRLSDRTRPGEPLFDPCDACGHAIYRGWAKLMDLAGIEKVPRSTIPAQRMRQTVATRIEKRGGTPSVWLGHTPHQVYERHYRDGFEIMLAEHEKGVWPLDYIGSEPRGKGWGIRRIFKKEA